MTDQEDPTITIEQYLSGVPVCDEGSLYLWEKGQGIPGDPQRGAETKHAERSNP